MAAVISASDCAECYTDYLGTPTLRARHYYIPLVAVGSKYASAIRTREGYALSKAAIFNFKRVVITPLWEGGNIVFPFANGDIAFTLKVAGDDG